MKNDTGTDSGIALSLTAGILIFLGTLYVALVEFFVGSFLANLGISGLLGLPEISSAQIIALGLWGIVCGAVTLLGAVWISSGERQKVKKGSILVLVFSILSWIGSDGGLFLGFVLGLVGAIIGLTWKPSIKEMRPAPPVPP